MSTTTQTFTSTTLKGRFTMRFLVAALFAITATVGAVTPFTNHAALAATANPACAIQYVVGHSDCYAPAQVARAERLTPWATRPDAAMNLTYGIKLSQVIVVTPPKTATTTTSAPTQINYLYGPLRHDYGRQGAAPIAIMIQEHHGHTPVTSSQGSRIVTVCGERLNLSPAADPNTKHPKYGPWYLYGNFKYRNASFGIVGNSGPALLETLACRLLSTR